MMVVHDALFAEDLAHGLTGQGRARVGARRFIGLYASFICKDSSQGDGGEYRKER